MAKIPKQDTLKEFFEEGLVLQDFRPYIGMSSLMSACKRRIWYDFRWSCDRYIDKRIARIFERGNLEEERVVRDLQAAGLKVTDALDEQVELVDDTGHIKGHPDGKVSKLPNAPVKIHCLEIKTKKASLYAKYLKEGLEKSDPAYWGQIHTYMGEQKLTRALFIVTNKDTEERDYKRIEYDATVHRDCMSIGMDVLTSEAPPKKIGTHTWFECKMCSNMGICHKDESIKRTCRSCKHVNIEMEGKWSCGYHDDLILMPANQMAACPDYELDEVFLQ
jgi:hypothetical protein